MDDRTYDRLVANIYLAATYALPWGSGARSNRRSLRGTHGLLAHSRHARRPGDQHSARRLAGSG
jgi:hypothetical protein